MDQATLYAFIAFIALSFVSTFFWLRFLGKRRERDLERAERLAASLGLRLLDRDESLRRSYDLSGQAGVGAQLERLPAPILKFLKRNAAIVIEGVKGGQSLVVFEDNRGTGRNQQIYTVVRASFRETLPFELHVTREGAFTKLGKAFFQLPDLELGDPAIDPLVRIKASDPEAARTLLSRREVRAALSQALSVAPDLRMSSAWVEWSRSGTILDEAVLAPVAEALLSLAKALSPD